MLGSTSGALIEEHDLVMFDLDGVVYVDGAALPGVADHVAAVRSAGLHVAFVTNNAFRRPDSVAQRLRGMGVEATTGDVVTSAQAAAGLIRREHGEGSVVLALGGPGLWGALESEGLRPVEVSAYDEAAPERPVVLASGYSPDVRWSDIMRAAVVVRDGMPYVASNSDRTIPTSFGAAPGHGVLVSTICGFAGVEPVVAGKPSTALLEETVRRVGGSRPLMVGDRLDTDIEGAHNMSLPSMLVLTGVSGLSELVGATAQLRPTYISTDLSGLFEPHPAPEVDEHGTARLGGWTAAARQGRLEVRGAGPAVDWWRVVSTTAWLHLDEHGSALDIEGTHPPEDATDPPPG